MEKNRSASRSMVKLLNDDKSETSDIKEILNALYKYYKDLYMADPDANFDYKNDTNIKLSEDQKMTMEGPIQMSELRNSLKSCKKSRSLGLDGLTYEFYVMFFSLLGKHLLAALNESYETIKLYLTALRGVITIIPKKQKDTRFIKNMCPISLLNCDYKLLEKVLAQRIKPNLEFLIHTDQKGFLSNRKISANIRCIIDIMQHLQECADNEDADGLVISIDYEKCFDRIEKASLISALEFFNFGESYRKWTELLYNGSESCVINAGNCSKFFPVTRGCKQGAPNSAYYFLVITEIVAILLRNNSRIEGIKIGDFIKLFGQYADDMDIYCKNKKTNLHEIGLVLSEYCKKSGMKINYEKTTLYQIGKHHKGISEIYTIKGMKVEKERINVLGVWICADKQQMMYINYKDILEKSESILKLWQHRNLSLIRKVEIIYSLVASLFVYRMYVLPQISLQSLNKIKTMCENFLWNGRRPKIPTKRLQNRKDQGGLGLTNFELKDASLKVSWVQYVFQDSFTAECAYVALNYYIKEKIWECNLKESDVNSIFSDSFWRCVLQVWCKFHYVHEVEEPNMQTIWYNSHIRINAKPFFWKKNYKEGLMYVHQLVCDGEFIPYEEAENKFSLGVLQFNQLETTIPKNWKSGIVNKAYVDTKLQSFLKEKKPVRRYYYEMSDNPSLLFDIYVRFQTALQCDVGFNEYAKSLRNIKKLTTNPKLRSFQYRLLNCAIICNIDLKRWKIKDDDLCTHCHLATETVLHIFTECEKSKEIYRIIPSIVAENTNILHDFHLSKKDILLNFPTQTLGSLYNSVLLAAKRYIYVNQCLSKPLTQTEFRQIVENYRKFEFYYAKSNGKYSYYCKKWLNIKVQKPDINAPNNAEDLVHEQEHMLECKVCDILST